MNGNVLFSVIRVHTSELSLRAFHPSCTTFASESKDIKRTMKTNLTYDMYVPTRVMFGAGMLDKLSEQPMPGKRALIVISNGKSTRASGYLSLTEEQLHKAGVETFLFDGVMPNPTVGNVNAGAKVARENGCDFLVALGAEA